MKSQFSITLFLLFLGSLVFAQQDSTTTVVLNDSLATQIDSIIAIEKGSDYPNPKKAALLSLAIPGAGHIYNKKYWKAPLTWAALGTSIFFINRNTKIYKVFQESYCTSLELERNVKFARTKKNLECYLDESEPKFLDSNSGNSSGLYSINGPDWRLIYNELSTREPSEILPLRNSFDKYRQLSWISVVGVQLLSSAWVFVDGHFLDFDMNEDLSLRVKPSLESTFAGTPVAGVGLVFVLGE